MSFPAGTAQFPVGSPQYNFFANDNGMPPNGMTVEQWNWALANQASADVSGLSDAFGGMAVTPQGQVIDGTPYYALVGGLLHPDQVVLFLDVNGNVISVQGTLAELTSYDASHPAVAAVTGTPFDPTVPSLQPVQPLPASAQVVTLPQTGLQVPVTTTVTDQDAAGGMDTGLVQAPIGGITLIPASGSSFAMPSATLGQDYVGGPNSITGAGVLSPIAPSGAVGGGDTTAAPGMATTAAPAVGATAVPANIVDVTPVPAPAPPAGVPYWAWAVIIGLGLALVL
jgi:hypothetical protein